MGLHKFKPIPSGRMGMLWTLASIRNAALLEFGCMGHMHYGRVFLNRAGVVDACKLYSTHIDETDIALGGTERLSRAVADIACRDKPRVLFLLPSAVPEIIGTDIPALCKELQPDYPDMRLLPFRNVGFDINQHRGIQETLLHLVKTLPQNVPKTPLPTFNLIGSCADLFRFQADAGEIVRILEGTFRLKPLCVLTSDTSVEQIEQLGGAHVNLVFRREGVPAAEQLQQRFGTPYLLARPYGIQGTCEWIEQLAQITGIMPDRSYVNGQRDEAQRLISPARPLFRPGRNQSENRRLSVGGHADVVRGILSFACGELSLPQGRCWCDSPAMAAEDIPYFTEEQWTQAVQGQEKGLLMASGEVLAWAGRNEELQIANPDIKLRLNPYEPPFVGFRGAIHLASLWVNEALRQQ
ncbi:nitrogen fixation protein NifE|uniref:Nitrogenase molybdenum-iron protein, alpha and beta chains n=1 Tax=Dendrosporobacter quercicolus TaxID=146817 RepID=A0A1G9NIC4_9FIRM|nr:nitrogenase component 1 [Dendrosporobacter quercicolus]NSL47347.1 nitrogen fixation protein NifE [Dendrosporobacter quercicolus DSM 1736]SDL86141.1 Nitrogenase molybdenum-iron protein, alpha and beta chains [Dendrosporobacter quercicolus]